MSDTGEEREFQSDQIVDKKRFAKSMIWNWFGYFKNDKVQKMTVCIYKMPHYGSVCGWWLP